MAHFLKKESEFVHFFVATFWCFFVDNPKNSWSVIFNEAPDCCSINRSFFFLSLSHSLTHFLSITPNQAFSFNFVFFCLSHLLSVLMPCYHTITFIFLFMWSKNNVFICFFCIYLFGLSEISHFLYFLYSFSWKLKPQWAELPRS